MWVDLESIMLSEINHPEKDKYSMLSLICGIKKKKKKRMRITKQIQKTIHWLPVRRGKEEGQDRGWGLRDTK